MNNIRLTGVTFAPVNAPAMLQFYNSVFDCDLQPFEALGMTLYRG